MNRIFKCLNSFLIARHSFHPRCIFSRGILKTKDYKFFQEKKMNLLKKDNMFSVVSLSKSKFLTCVAPHWCRTRVALVLLVSYLCLIPSRSRVALLLLVCVCVCVRACVCMCLCVLISVHLKSFS